MTGRAAAAPAREPGASLWPWLLAPVGLLAYGRTLGTYFAQDDFFWLQWAAGGDALPPGAPRFLGAAFWFRGLHGLFGNNPWVFHAGNLILHVGAGLCLFALLKARIPAAWAATAAALFLTSPAVFDVVHWACQAIYPLSLVLLGVTLWLVVGADRVRHRWAPWTALGAYVLALASKEIAVGAAPVLALIEWRRAGRTSKVRAALFVALAALFALPWLGARGSAPGEAYGMRPGVALLNLPGYAAAAAFGAAAFRQTSDLGWARQPAVQALGWVVLLLWLIALWRRRSGAAWLGFLWFLALLAPVLAMERQFYFYYLYCALPGLWASLLLLLPSGSPAALRAVPVAGALLVVAHAAAVELRSRSMLASAPLPTDFVLRRALIARNATDDLSRYSALYGPEAVLIGQQPVETSFQGASTTEKTDYLRDPFWDENVRAALSAGRALQLVHPGFERTVFRPWLLPEDSARAVVAYRIDGHLRVTSYADYAGVEAPGAGGSLDDGLARAGRLIEKRLYVEALGELLAARAMAPDHPEVLVNLGVIQARLGDTASAVHTLSRAVAAAPQHLEALYNLGVLHWRTGREAEAREVWDQLFTLAPESDLARGARALMSGKAR